MTTAYALQDAMAALRVSEGEPVLACTTTQFGLQGPIRGTLYDAKVYREGDSLNPQSICNLAIEDDMASKIDQNRPI